MQKIYSLSLLTFTVFLTLLANAQHPDPADFYTSIRKYDLSRLWRADSIVTEGEGGKAAFPEPIGYLGENFQRFDIHYISVVRAKDNPRVYNVIGKTRVNNNISNFPGTIQNVKELLNVRPCIILCLSVRYFGYDEKDGSPVILMRNDLLRLII